MNSKLLKQLIFASKRAFYVFLVQTVSMQFILASNLSGQGLEDIQLKLNVENETVTSIFKKIEGQTDFTFSYTGKVAKDHARIDLRLSGTLRQVLEQIAGKTTYNFRRINNEIFVIPRQKKEKVKITEETLDRTISGKVSDEKGEPLIGATIKVKGTLIGTITDIDGNFSLSVPDDAKTLEVSFIGFKSIEVPIGAQTNFDISIEPDVSALQEVVVIGYGTQDKEKFNGAISKVETKELTSYATANFEQGLLGNIAGVQVFSNGKNPGENSVIQIRGLNTITAGQNPLIVVDGNPLTEGTSMSSVNTNDIESVSVLKGAASAAIYGSRASSGVIFITTKKGSAGKLSVTYDGYVGVQERMDKFELTDAYETALFDFDARNYGYISGGNGRSISDDNATRDANGGGKRSRIQPFLQDYIDGVPGLTNTNWQDAAFRRARQQSHFLNLSGGNNSTNYAVSFGYFDQENIVVDSDYERYTTNIRLNTEFSDHVRFGISSNVSMSSANPTGEAGWSRSEIGFRRQADPVFTMVLMQPYYPIYNTDGSFAIADQIDDNNDNWDGPISENIIAQAALSDFTNNQFRVFGNTFAEVEPIDGLTYKVMFGGDYGTSVEEYFGPSNFGNYRTPVADNPTQGSRSDSKRENFIIENTITYKKAIGLHAFELLGGHSYQQELRSTTYLESRDFADDLLRNLGGATTITSSASSSKWALESYFSRIQYDFDGRYSFSASLRRDGSSRFGANTKQGTFSSLSGGWTLSEESFFPKNDLLDFAKIRLSWGQTGNNQIGDFSAIARLGDDNYNVDGSLSPGLFINSAPNADLSWETSTSLNYGLDLGLLDRKIQLTAEYYITKTTDMLLDVPVPQQSGFSESLQNIGEMENKGFELELRGNDYSLGQVKLGFNVNFATNKNKVLALGEGQEQIISSSGVDFITKVGHPIAQFYNYDVIGVYRTQEQLDGDGITPLAGTEVGDFVVRDADGDGVITPDDRVMQGDYNPDFTYGFGLTASWRGFDLGVQFFGVEGRKVSDNMVNRSESGEGFFVPTQYYFDNYFNERNPNGFFRRPDFSSFSSAGRLTRKSNLSVLDADYFRMRSLQVGYTLPKTITDNIGLTSARIYFTGNNLFNITDFRGINADGLDTRSRERQSLTRGYIHSASPLSRFMALGVNVKF